MRKLSVSIAAFSVIGSVFFSYGIIQAFQVTSFNKANPSVVNETALSGAEGQASETVSIKKFSMEEGNVRIVVVGDSIARGTGDSTGAGITGNFRHFFAERGREMEIINAAVDGFTTEELHEQLQKDAMGSAIADADIVILSIGGNDVRKFVQNGEIGWETSILADGLTQYLSGLTEVLRTIREVNQTCLVFVIGLYNPIDEQILEMIGIPEAGTDYFDAFADWNYQTQKLIDADPYSLYVPTYDLFKWNLEEFMSYDRIHPNSAGYQAISKRLVQYFELTYSDPS